MKRTLIAVLAVLLLASLMGCRQRQAGLTEYHEALSLIDQGDTPAALTLLEKAGHRATTDSANASGLHFMMADPTTAAASATLLHYIIGRSWRTARSMHAVGHTASWPTMPWTWATPKRP